jgi:tRNA modification GTPase
LLAHAEATLDFPDEELPEDLDANFHFDINAISTEIAQHLDDGSRGERLRDGFYVAIVGAPNVGKSTLLNCLAGREAAIVSETAGTTRDVIEVHLDLGGYPVTFADTAGLRVAESEVEEEGVRRARDRAAKADLTLAVFDASLWPKRDPETLGIVEKSGAPGAVITVLNKVDLAAPKQTAALDSGTVAVSAVQGTGIDDLLAGITGAAEESFSGAAATPALTRTRHRSALEDCVEALNRAASVEGEVLAEDLRLAVRSLGRITGAVDVEDLLDRIFAEFCIGK